ncbi:MAG: sulfotransferase domain-containing protein [Desulfobacterales bacterium]|nr:sulfotransferase domain-containing protein [Desulfobacterales bacterium]
MKPDVLIIGAAKCGTSSLACNLNRHPAISIQDQELHFFSKYWDRGADWYLSLFDRNAGVRGEKSPTYLYFPESHERIHTLLPEAKLIVLLREPVSRAFSNWNMRYTGNRLVRMGLEFNRCHPRACHIKSLNFSALADFYLEQDKKGGDRAMRFRQPLDIFHRGLYMPQISHLLRYVKRENILFLITERFFADEKNGYADVCRFLNVPVVDLKQYKKRRTGDYPYPVPEQAAAKLHDFYRPYNEKLFRFLGDRVAEWDKQPHV